MLVWTGTISCTVIFVMIVFHEAGKNADDASEARIISEECVNGMLVVDGLRSKLQVLEKGSDGQFGPEMRGTMRELLLARVKYLGDCGGGVETDSFYPELRRRFETAMAGEMYAECQKAEELGRLALENRNFEDALRYYTVALYQQGMINEQFPSAEQASVGRVATYTKKVEEARLEPLIEAYRKASVDADAAYERGDYELARTLYSELRSMLIGLSYKVPKSYLDSDARLRRVERRVMDLSAMIKGRELDKETELAEQSADEGDYASAADAFARALAIQRSIESDYPGSSLAAPSRFEKLDKLRQNVLARPLGTKIDDSLSTLDISLRSGECGLVSGLLADARQTASEMTRLYPGCDYLKNANMDRIKYLFGIRDEVCQLRLAVMDHLRPVPGNPDWMIMDREVSQLIFEKICGSNPSALKGVSLPVEGVTMEEARTFSERMSWITGFETRLPGLDVYMSLVQPVDGIYVRNGIWSGSTAPGRQIQPVATSTADLNGIYDLLGNVSEWVEKDGSYSNAGLVVGGNVRDNPIRISEIPQEGHVVTERVRNNGFRLMIRAGAGLSQ
ncbi:MAG: hypothetical protein WC360_00270 [Opitutales bacterium]